MAFHHDGKGRASFGPGKSSTTAPGGKVSGHTPHEHEGGQEMAPHGGSSEEHVTKTHPGETQPHPETGVHAFHAHHTGGGKFRSHTHHEDGTVETRDHQNEGDMHQAMNEAFPPSDDQQHDSRDGAMDFEEALGGVGGESDGGGYQG